MLYIMQSVQRRGKVKTEIIMSKLFNGYKVIYIMYMPCIFACGNINCYIHTCSYIHICILCVAINTSLIMND